MPVSPRSALTEIYNDKHSTIRLKPQTHKLLKNRIPNTIFTRTLTLPDPTNHNPASPGITVPFSTAASCALATYP